MADHKFPLQMEALALAVQSFGPVQASRDNPAEDTKLILLRATAFLGWTQGSTPSHREPNPALRPPLRVREALGDATESPVR